MHYLSMVGIFRQENAWLDEWIQYHHAVGVEHFYMVSDDVTPFVKVSDRILQPYVDRGLVTLVHVNEMGDAISGNRAALQDDVYKEIIKRAVGKTRWLGIIDLDELLLPRSCDDLREFLREFEEYSGLAVHVQLFGTSGYIKRPPTLINHLLRRAETMFGCNGWLKCIIKPDKTNTDVHWYLTLHHPPMTEGAIVKENHVPVHGGYCGNITTEKIALNHYALRSWQDYCETKEYRNQFGLTMNDYGMDYFLRHDRNEVFDDEISRRFGHVMNCYCGAKK